MYINSLLATLNARAGTIRTVLEGPRHRHGQLRVDGSGVLTSINFKSGQEGLGVGETQVRDILCITAIYEVEYEPVIGYPPTRQVAIPREILEEHSEVEVRYDLIDCAIDVCSVEVSDFT